MNNSVSVPSRTAGGDPAAFSKPPVRARIEKAIRNHGIERSLKTVVPQEVYEDLKKELSNIEKQQ